MAWFKKTPSESSLRAQPMLSLPALLTTGVVGLFPLPAWSQTHDASNASSHATSGAKASDPDPTKTLARQHFQRGVELFNQGDNEGALAEFRTANELVYHPKVWFNIGMVLAEMNQPVEAVDAFERALAGDGLEQELRATATQRREALLDTIGMLQVECTTNGAKVLVDGVERGTTPLPQAIPLPSGRHVVELLKENYKLLRREPVVTGRGHFVLEVVMEPHAAVVQPGLNPSALVTSLSPPAPAKSQAAPSRAADSPSDAWRKPVAYTSLAIGGASLVLAGVSVVAGRSLCPTAGCPPAADDANAGGYENWRTTAFVSAGAFALFGGTGLVLLLTAPDDASSAVAISVGPRVIRASIGF